MWHRQLVTLCIPVPCGGQRRELRLHTGLCGHPWIPAIPHLPVCHGSVVSADARLSRVSLLLKVTLSQHRCGYSASLCKETEAACVAGAELMLEFIVLLSTTWLSPASQPPPAKVWGMDHEGLSRLCCSPAHPVPGCSFRHQS